MSRPLPPKGSRPTHSPASKIPPPRPVTLTVGELAELSAKTGRSPIELRAAHVLANAPAPPLAHPLRRQRGDTMRQLAAFVDLPLSPDVDWFRLGQV